MLWATMRLLTTLPALVLLISVSGCAYPRRATHISPAPAGVAGRDTAPADMWTLRIIDAGLPPLKPTGLPWDDDGSGPDAYVRVLVDGQPVWKSEVIEDEVHPQWKVTLPNNIFIPDNRPFRIEVWDHDGGLGGDPLGYLAHTGLPPTATPDAEASLLLSNAATLRIVVSAPRPQQGVGLEVEIHPDAMHVLKVLPYSPAARAGIVVGDRIVEIGPVYVSHMADQDALSRLSLAGDRGEKLVVVDKSGTRREIELDHDPLWLSL